MFAEGKLANEMAFYHKVTECTKFKRRICLHVHVAHFCSVMCVVSLVGASGELLKKFCASCNVTVVQMIFLMWFEHYQALWNGQLHRLVCSSDDHSLSRFIINPDTLYFSITYKALEHTMDCIGNKKVCVCVYIYIYIYIFDVGS